MSKLKGQRKTIGRKENNENFEKPVRNYHYRYRDILIVTFDKSVNTRIFPLVLKGK